MPDAILEAMPDAPLVALLTDFGTRDSYVGVMKGVMLGIAPHVRLVDITHEIAPQDVVGAAWVVDPSWRYFRERSIFVFVVDPGVGSARRAVAVQVASRIFVGPDNGLFSYVFAAEPAGVAVALDNPRYQLPTPSATFHGRDIFAPATAHLAGGVALDRLGSPVPPESLVSLHTPQPEWHGDTLVAHVLHIDHYGNLITDVGRDLTATILGATGSSLRIAGHVLTARGRTFADGPEGEPFFLLDSSGYLAIALRNGSAAAALAAGRGPEVLV